MQSKKEKRKIAIALQTYEMLVENGVDNFSVNNLLETISMSKGNFYHYFKNKDELFCETLKVAYDSIVTKYQVTVEARNFEEKLCKLFFLYLSKEKEIVQYLTIINQMYYLFSNEKNTYLYSYMQENYAYLFYALNALMEEEIQNGTLKEEILQMQKAICATADGMLTHAFMLKDYDLHSELKSFFAFISKQYQV